MDTELATPGQIISALVVLTLFAASPLMLVRGIMRYRRGETLVPYEHRKRPQFGLIEIGLTVLIYFGLNLAAYYVLKNWLDMPLEAAMDDFSPDQFLTVIVVNSLAVAASCCALALLVPLRRGASMADLGITLRHAAADIALGGKAFLLMAGFVYLLQSVLFQLFPQSHPLLDLISENPQPKYFLGAVISAAIMAPIFEEVFFRATLQGWLEKFFLYHEQPGSDNDLPVQASDDAIAHQEIVLAQPANADIDADARSDNPYHSPSAASDPSDYENAPTESPGRTAWGPIVISSLIFAAAHIGQGPAPIPLFFLAMCLGYLYQKTHRLLPCITLHALLNSTSIVMLWLSVAK